MNINCIQGKILLLGNLLVGHSGKTELYDLLLLRRKGLYRFPQLLLMRELDFAEQKTEG